jgi:hypothetical protein
VAQVSAPLSTEQSGAFPTITQVPLSQVNRPLYPGKERLSTAWRHLAAAKASDEDTLYHLLVVLIETVPDLKSEERPPALPQNWGEQARKLQATPAHPRAYSGTKYQPPKSSQLGPIDIRPYLCDPSSIQRILVPLSRFLPAVRRRLLRSGYSTLVVEGIEREFPLTTDSSRLRQKKQWALPAAFVQFVLPLVRWASPRELSKYLALFKDLDLEHDQQMLAAVSCLIAASDAHRAYSWSRIAVVLPAHRRVVFIRTVMETNACANQAASRTGAQVEELNDLATDAQFPLWIGKLLDGIRDGVSAGYLLAGFRFAARFCPDHRFDIAGRCDNFPESAVEELIVELIDDPYSGWFPMALWERSARLPGLADVIRTSKWRGFVSAAKRYFEFLVGIVYHELPERALQKKWTAIRQQIPEIETLLMSVSAAHQPKAVGCVADWLWWLDDPVDIATRLPEGYRLLRRLAAPPFSTAHGAAGAWCSFLGVAPRGLLERFLSAPDSSFEAIERACVRENEALLIMRGFDCLIRHLAPFTVEAFLAAPKRLAKMEKVLGTVALPVRAEIIKCSQGHPLFDPALQKMPISEAYAKIKPHLTDKHTNPFPSRLRAWLEEKIVLSPGSLERHQRVFTARLLLTRLDLIEQLVFERLKRGFPAGQLTKEGEHALQLLGYTRENRRGLRRFLSAHWSGDHSYLSKHPATIAWYRKHKAISRDLWENGIPFQSDGFTIQIERDPLEILKLGTYVGSCLAVGGLCAYSAAAALLDANKQVLYGRDRRGSVIARQLLAISDDDRLVCFTVYPAAASPSVKAAFREYDFAFADALDLPLYNRGEEGTPDYQVGSILSAHWWDDESWDFKIGE